MAHFQVPEDRSLYDSRTELRRWPTPGNADGFRFYVQGTTGEEQIGIHRGQEVELQLTGAKDSTIETMESIIAKANVSVTGGDLAAQLSPNPSPVLVSNANATSDKHKFKVKAVNAGTTFLIARDAKLNHLASLKVVVGDFKDDPRFEVDLIANVCRGNDALKIHALQRMLNNNDGKANRDNVFEQKSSSNYHPKYGNMTCGLVAMDRTRQVFENSVEPAYDWYMAAFHEPVTKVMQRTDLKYKPKAIEAARKAIVDALHEKPPKAVRVGVVDNPRIMTPIRGKLVAYYDGGHTVVIVGCNKAGNQFLYIDPWGNGSMMHYEGGIYKDQFPNKCFHLGIFEVAYDDERKPRSVDKADIRRNII